MWQPLERLIRLASPGDPGDQRLREFSLHQPPEPMADVQRPVRCRPRGEHGQLIEDEVGGYVVQPLERRRRAMVAGVFEPELDALSRPMPRAVQLHALVSAAVLCQPPGVQLWQSHASPGYWTQPTFEVPTRMFLMAKGGRPEPFGSPAK